MEEAGLSRKMLILQDGSTQAACPQMLGEKTEPTPMPGQAGRCLERLAPVLEAGS